MQPTPNTKQPSSTSMRQAGRMLLACIIAALAFSLLATP